MFLEAKRLRLPPLRRARRRGAPCKSPRVPRAPFLGRRRGRRRRRRRSRAERDFEGRMRPDGAVTARFLCSLILLARRPPHLVHVLQRALIFLCDDRLMSKGGAPAGHGFTCRDQNAVPSIQEDLSVAGFIPRERLEHGGLDERVHLGHGELVRRLIGDNPEPSSTPSSAPSSAPSASIDSPATAWFTCLRPSFLLLFLLSTSSCSSRPPRLVLHVLVVCAPPSGTTPFSEPLVWHELRP